MVEVGIKVEDVDFVAKSGSHGPDYSNLESGHGNVAHNMKYD